MKTIHEIQLNESASQTKTITEHDVALFAEVTNDYNPAHFDEEYASGTIFQKRICHGMLVGSLFSKIFGMDLPGKGTIYISQTLRFRRPVFLGDTIKAVVTVKELDLEKNRVRFDCVAYNEEEEAVVIGEAVLMPPKEVK
ncbi:MAG: MaoC family dehydratase [Bacilli bacterium]|nr:MaoC family dehydratase [Bacilli bacterium]